ARPGLPASPPRPRLHAVRRAPAGGASASTLSLRPGLMSKPKKSPQRWVCRACGATSNGWFGKCPTCDAWNSIEEEVVAPAPGERPTGPAKVIASTEAQTVVDRQPRRPCGLGEVDRVLGGGLVPGSVV